MQNKPAAGKFIWLSLGAALLAGIAVLFFTDRLLMPKYAEGIFEGNLIGEYYDSAKNHQLIILGDCEVYEIISPVALWEEYGISSYIRGSPQQLIWQSYYLLEDTLRYETPDAVLFSIYAMKYGEPQSEAYNRLTLDGMRFSPSKIAAVRASMTEGESLLSYFYPTLRYHERWQELTFEDLFYLFSRRKVSINGYMMRCDIKPAGSFPTPQIPADYSFGEDCWAYLDKARELCAEKGIEFVLFKAPVLHPYWFPQWDEQIEAYAAGHGLLYINALADIEEIGLDFNVDTYNAGLHLNVWGAEKMSRYLGGILSGLGLDDMRRDPDMAAAWGRIAGEYEALKLRQLEEIEQYGSVQTFVPVG